MEQAWWWGNTADNLTKISFIDHDNNGSLVLTGTVKLYRRKSNRTIDPVPMMTVVEHDIAGVGFSAGITISGIEGDRIDGAIKVEFVGDGSSTTDLNIRLNGDTGSNYTGQYLRANSSTVTAGPETVSRIFLTNDKGSSTSYGTTWIYPKSGQNRPMLLDMAYDAVQKWLYANWWNNTADELTSMKIYANTTNLVTGTIRISVPVNTKQDSPSFTLTVN